MNLIEMIINSRNCQIDFLGIFILLVIIKYPWLVKGLVVYSREGDKTSRKMNRIFDKFVRYIAVFMFVLVLISFFFDIYIIVTEYGTI